MRGKPAFISIITAILIAILMGTGISAATGVDFRLQTGPTSVTAGEIITVTIRVDAGNQELDTVEAHVVFDPAYLSVVDDSDDPVQGTANGVIIPGDITRTVLTNILLNRADNDAGSAGIACGIPVGGAAVGEDFVLGSIRFRTMEPTPGTELTFGTASGSRTVAARLGIDVTGSLTGTSIMITPKSSGGEKTGTSSDEPPATAPTTSESATTAETTPSTAGTTEKEQTTTDTTESAPQTAPEDKPLTWPMMGGIIGGVIVTGIVIYFVRRRPRF